MDLRLKKLINSFALGMKEKSLFGKSSYEDIEEGVSFTKNKFTDLTRIFSQLGSGYAKLFEKVRQGCFQSRQGFLECLWQIVLPGSLSLSWGGSV